VETTNQSNTQITSKHSGDRETRNWIIWEWKFERVLFIKIKNKSLW